MTRLWRPIFTTFLWRSHAIEPLSWIQEHVQLVEHQTTITISRLIFWIWEGWKSRDALTYNSMGAEMDLRKPETGKLAMMEIWSAEMVVPVHVSLSSFGHARTQRMPCRFALPSPVETEYQMLGRNVTISTLLITMAARSAWKTLVINALALPVRRCAEMERFTLRRRRIQHLGFWRQCIRSSVILKRDATTQPARLFLDGHALSMKLLNQLLAFKLVATISMTLVKFATMETTSVEMVAQKVVSKLSLPTSAP